MLSETSLFSFKWIKDYLLLLARITLCTLPDTLSHNFFLCHGQSDLGHWGMSKIHHRRSAKCFCLSFRLLQQIWGETFCRWSSSTPTCHPDFLANMCCSPARETERTTLEEQLHHSLISCNHHKNSHLASWTFSLLFVPNPGHTYYWAHSPALTPCLPQVPSGKRGEEPRGWDSSTLYRVPEPILLYAHNFLIRFTIDLSLSWVAWTYKSLLLPTSYVACHRIWVLLRTAFFSLQVIGSPQPTGDVFLPLSNMLTRKCGSSPWSCLLRWHPKTWQQSSLVQYHPEDRQYDDSEIKVSALCADLFHLLPRWSHST